MQDYNARGTITKIIANADDVFIFIFKSAGKYPATLKVKKFRAKSMEVAAFRTICDGFFEKSKITILRAHISSEKAVANGEPVKTTAGHDVWVPVIIADYLAVEMDSFNDADTVSGKPDTSPSKISEAPKPVATAQVMRNPNLEENHPAFATIPESDDGFPRIPF